jgi:hypothetical protein
MSYIGRLLVLLGYQAYIVSASLSHDKCYKSQSSNVLWRKTLQRIVIEALSKMFSATVNGGLLSSFPVGS